MGLQLRCYMDMQICREFIEYGLQKSLQVIMQNPQSREISFYGEEDNWPFPTDVCFLYDKTLGEISLNGKTGLIDSVISPVVEIIPTFINRQERIIYQGRIWTSSMHYLDNGEIEYTNPQLIKHFNSLKRFLKSNLQYQVIKKGVNKEYDIKVYISKSLLALEAEYQFA